MGLLTDGPLHLTAVHVETDITLTEFHNELSRRIYPNAPPAPGWGYVDWERDDEESLGLQAQRTRPGIPAIARVGNRNVLLARFMYDDVNKGLRRNMKDDQWEGYPASVRYSMRAVDVAILKANSFLILIASHDEDEINAVLSALAWSAEDLGVWRPSRTSVSIAPPDRDLFLWLIHKEQSHGRITDDLRLNDIRQAQVESPVGKTIRAMRGVDLERVEILAAIGSGHHIGPAKIVLYDKKLRFEADINYLLDGSFDVHRNGSAYDHPVPGPRLGVRATLDVALVVLPKLIAAYESDKTWTATARQQFREQCKVQARTLLS